MKTCIGRDEVLRLYELHSRGLVAYACSITTSFAAAEDALHQVFERLLRGDIAIEGAPESYLYRAIRNASLNQIRSRSRETALEDWNTRQEESMSNGRPVREKHRWFDSPSGMEASAFELQASLEVLPEEQREVVLMHVWGGMTFDEIAKALGGSANTAASRYRYGLRKLREQFQVTAAPQALPRRIYGPAQ